MITIDKKTHWEKIYETKALEECSWYEESPRISLYFLDELSLPLSAKIIDIGGGDSLFVDHLLDFGFTNITVLDISESAIERAKKRLGQRATLVTWIVEDVLTFKPQEKYDVWHDRATFHFMTIQKEINQYTALVRDSIVEGGAIVMATFAPDAPFRCSGIVTKRYSEEDLEAAFSEDFIKRESLVVGHTTPSGGIQNFTYCSFNRTLSIPLFNFE